MSQPRHYAPIQFYLTPSHACSYLPEKIARTQVAAPTHLIDTDSYSELIRCGFRRSGEFIYRPFCEDCTSCIPVRIPVALFKPDRTQRRTLKQHAGLNATQLPLHFSEEHYQLYLRYQSCRHPKGGMDEDNPSHYAQFMLTSHIHSCLILFREEGQLRMVSLIDHLNDGLSSVYTFYEPDMDGCSFGTYSILWQIEACRRLNLPYLYLGYWIKNNRKMSYKNRFQPLEIYQDGYWQRLTDS